MLRLVGRVVLFGGVAALSVILVGCLNAQRATRLRYDEATDTFHVLCLYTHIRGERAEDYDYLAELWTKRENIIPIPMIGVFNEPAVLREGGKSLTMIELGERKEGPTTREFGVALDQVQVRPGRFFLSEDKTLCYYQQVSLPGKTVDALLAEGNGAMRDAWADAIRAENQRRLGGGPRRGWDELTKQVMGMTKEEKSEQKDNAPEKIDNFLVVLDDKSLGLLLKACEGKSLGFGRTKGRFEIALPLSNADIAEVQALRKAVKEAVDAVVKKPELSDREGKLGLQALLERVDVKAGEEVLRLALTADDLSHVLEVRTPASESAPKGEFQYMKAVEAAKKRGIPVAEGVRIKTVVGEFGEGKLK